MSLRVLQVHARYRQPGGEDAVVRAECEVLQRAGHAVHQHLADNPTGGRAAALALAASVWNPAAARRVGEAVTSFGPDVAHVHNTWFAHSPSVAHALRRRGVPVVMTIHNYRLSCANGLFLRDGVPCEDCLARPTVPAVRHACYRDSHAVSAVAAAGIALHRQLATWQGSVDRFLVLSRFAQERLVRAGIPAERIRLSGNAVADPGARPCPPSASRNVVFVGRLSREKGVAVLLRAWREAQPHALRLVIAGDGPEREGLEREAPPGVEFVGRLPSESVGQLLLQARALVIPSIWYEGQPLVALEALAAGLPLIVSDIGGLPEVVGASGAGWFAAPGDPSALAARLLDLEDDGLVDGVGRLARARYEQTYTPDISLERLERTYGEVTSHVAT